MVVDGALSSAPFPGDTVFLGEGVHVLQCRALFHVMTGLLADMTVCADQGLDCGPPGLAFASGVVVEEEVRVGSLVGGLRCFLYHGHAAGVQAGEVGIVVGGELHEGVVFRDCKWWATTNHLSCLH